jgi:conjugal transfer pilus assembly protein TraI
MWNALQESLWQWLRRVDVDRAELQWRDGVDACPTQAASIWIASRLLPPAGLSYLQSADESLPEALLRIIGGERVGRLCEIVEEAYQAAIDQDLARRGNGSAATQAGVQIEHRLLEALRGLCREKWTLNTPGGRLWFTEGGVFLVWKAAANDVIVRMRAEGITGVPRDPDTLAELLTAHGVFAPNPLLNAGLKHYYKLIPQMRGVPKQGLEVVKIADTQLLGLQLEGVDQIAAELLGSPSPRTAAPEEEPPPPKILDLPLASPSPATSASPQELDATLPPLPPRTSSVSSHEGRGAKFEQLRRFGPPGLVLQRLAHHLLAEPHSLPIVPVAEGAALGFPEAIVAFCPKPQEFLAACESQGLLVPEKVGGRRFLRTRAADQPHLPAQYVVLATRVAKHLPLSGAQR